MCVSETFLRVSSFFSVTISVPSRDIRGGALVYAHLGGFKHVVQIVKFEIYGKNALRFSVYFYRYAERYAGLAGDGVKSV